MEKQEFLDKMRLALSGKVPSDTGKELRGGNGNTWRSQIDSENDY